MDSKIHVNLGPMPAVRGTQPVTESQQGELERLTRENALLKQALMDALPLAQDRCTALRAAGLRMAADVAQDSLDQARAALNERGKHE